MFGIRGLDAFGMIHVGFGCAAIGLGALVALTTKGTARHKFMGRAYVAAMVMLNATALLIYDLSGRFGPFHVASVVSLATIAAGLLSVLTRRPRAGWAQLHGTFMCWSYVGLIAAFLSEIAVRIPGVGFGPAVITATIVVTVGGAVLIHTRIPRILHTGVGKRTV